MGLGEKLRQARLDAGLSQRELCAGEVTRNMLSQIENGTARPSMKTLAYFAQRLGKPVSWFLEETAVVSLNTSVMHSARVRFDTGDWAGAVEALADFSQPDTVYERERDMLWVWSHLYLAQQAADNGQIPYARQLLDQGDIIPMYGSESLRRERLLLLGRLGQKVSEDLPSLDEELLLRARETEDLQRAARLLDAVQNQESPRWNLLRGENWLARKEYQKAAACFHRAEEVFPKETAPKLEQCYKELGDFKRAYEYACKRR